MLKQYYPFLLIIYVSVLNCARNYNVNKDTFNKSQVYESHFLRKNSFRLKKKKRRRKENPLRRKPWYFHGLEVANDYFSKENKYILKVTNQRDIKWTEAWLWPNCRRFNFLSAFSKNIIKIKKTWRVLFQSHHNRNNKLLPFIVEQINTS